MLDEFGEAYRVYMNRRVASLPVLADPTANAPLPSAHLRITTVEAANGEVPTADGRPTVYTLEVFRRRTKDERTQRSSSWITRPARIAACSRSPKCTGRATARAW
jgi:hypothetical protein